VIVEEFFCVEFDHPVTGWTLLRDVFACATKEIAQRAISHRLCEVPATRREKAAHAYRIVRYVREAQA
jgi:hypothetical protein